MSYLIQCTGFLYIGKWNTFKTWNSRRVFGVFSKEHVTMSEKKIWALGLGCPCPHFFGGKAKLVWYITNKREIAYHFYLLLTNTIQIQMEVEKYKQAKNMHVLLSVQSLQPSRIVHLTVESEKWYFLLSNFALHENLVFLCKSLWPWES